MVRWVFRFFCLLGSLIALPVQAQEEPGDAGDDGCDGGGCSVIEIGGGTGGPSYEGIEIDPFAEVPAEEAEEPNRPEPIKVGEWEPPALKPDMETQRLSLEAEQSATPGDVNVRYRLAQFYVEQGWFEHAEAELLRCAELDRDSIRPWESLITLYRRCLGGEDGQFDEFVIAFGPGPIRMPRRPRRGRNLASWIGSDPVAEGNLRISRAYRELLARRPDDIARRREFLAHLRQLGDHEGIAAEARLLLARMPTDAETRYLLAEALRMTEGDLAGARRELEETLRTDPSHARAAIRLARLFAVSEGPAAAERILALEQRAFFHLFQRRELSPVPYREDVFRMARNLAGPEVARRLWDEAMTPPTYDRNNFDRRGFERWLEIKFPHAQPRDRAEVIRTLARRGDEGAAAMLLSFLWHLDDYLLYGEGQLVERNVAQEAEEEAVAAVASLGGIVFPVAERFLAAAKESAHRRRAVQVLRRLRDARAVGPLLDALAYDTDEQAGYGVAAALEELANPRAVDGLVEAALDVRRPLPRRREAAEALASFKDSRSVVALTTLRKDPEFQRVCAYGLLRLAGDAEAYALLEQHVRDRVHAAEVLRLAAKCEDARLEALFLLALETGPEEIRPSCLALLRQRFWKSAEAKVRGIFLKEADSPAVSAFALAELGALGGEEVARKLAAIVERARDELWPAAARAYAETGDPEAVRYFARLKILSKDADRRRLAEELHSHAAKRQAQRERASSGE